MPKVLYPDRVLFPIFVVYNGADFKNILIIWVISKIRTGVHTKTLITTDWFRIYILYKVQEVYPKLQTPDQNEYTLC